MVSDSPLLSDLQRSSFGAYSSCSLGAFADMQGNDAKQLE